ncbi:MAG TPA: glycoside hydrolase family 13 protein [Clostridia bacterium]|jgi:glycosidase|nr:glycoside hydrolase family 13 protein [Clostridia bacterium]
MRKVLYNSRSIEFKKPFGAVSTTQEIEIIFPVHVSLCATGVQLVLRRDEDGYIKYFHLTLKCQEGAYNVYTAKFTVDVAGVHYYRFEIQTEKGILFVGRNENTGNAVIGDWLPEWQLTVFKEGFSTPDWLKGGLIYHIFPDRFARIEDGSRPSHGTFNNWYQQPSIGDERGYMADDFFGGNLKGVISKLDYLASLGVTCIYFSPIFESFSNHRYDTGDYLKIDELFGTEEEFKELIEKAKVKGISIILDGVFNHTGSDSIYFNKLGKYDSIGAYQSQESPYYDWFTFTNWPDEYLCWWGVTVVPTVARDAKGYHELITGRNGVIEKWTQMGVRGWRLDVVDELSSQFVEDIRKCCKDISKETVVIGEVWEDASTKESYGEKRKYFIGDQLDGVMNYPFKEAIIKLMRDRDIKTFISSIYEIYENYPKCALDSSMTLLGTHDTVRILTALADIDVPATKQERSLYKLTLDAYNVAKQRLYIASILQYILPGIPTLYYGDEVGMQGFEDPLNRETFPISGWDEDILNHYIMLGLFRKKYREELTNEPLEIKEKEGLLILTRGKIVTFVNLTNNEYILKKEYKNELTGESVNIVPSMTALVCVINKG